MPEVLSAESAPRAKKAGKLALWHVEEEAKGHERTASRTDTERHMTDWAQSGGAGVEGVEGRPSLNYSHMQRRTWTGLRGVAVSVHTLPLQVPSRCAAAEVRLQAHDVIGRRGGTPDQLALTTA